MSCPCMWFTSPWANVFIWCINCNLYESKLPRWCLVKLSTDFVKSKSVRSAKTSKHVTILIILIKAEVYNSQSGSNICCRGLIYFQTVLLCFLCFGLWYWICDKIKKNLRPLKNVHTGETLIAKNWNNGNIGKDLRLN